MKKEKDKKSLVPFSKELADPLSLYWKEVQQYPFLTAKEEYALAKKYREEGDSEAAKKLVMSHLRLVIKIAMEYRRSYFNTLDLIQEGNVGLLHAVKKFDPDKGARLGYYATMWIRSYVLKFILDNFRLIKIGTTKEQKKLFYNLIREKEKFEALGITPDSKMLSESLAVSQKAVEEMTLRLSAPEYALEAPRGKEGDALLKDFIAIDEKPLEEQVEDKERQNVLETKMEEFSHDLNKREQTILKQRLLADLPITLQEIADDYGITKERVRQIESRIMEKLKKFFEEHGINQETI